FTNLRHLHSFPTRRSSDLCFAESMNPQVLMITTSARSQAASMAYPSDAKTPSISSESTTFFAHPRLISRTFDFRLSTFDFGIVRSEEHTSELQSRFDLVCR